MKIIIGLGKTGLSCIKYFTETNKINEDLLLVDTRDKPPGYEDFHKKFPNIKTFFGKLKKEIMYQASEIIISPGVSMQEPVLISCKEKGINIISDIELFTKKNKKPIIAITGSNGKSTVTSLVHNILLDAGIKSQIGGNIGIPVLNLIEKETDYYVFELSSFQLETTYSLKTRSSVILNITHDHIERHGSFESYISAKQRIYNNCDIAVINKDERNNYYLNELSIKNIIYFGSNKPQKGDFGIYDNYIMYGKDKIHPIDKLQLKGKHNLLNVLASLALVKFMDLPQSTVLKTIQNFSGLEHRCKKVTIKNGVEWYNDSKATNISSTKAAIESLSYDNKKKIILIAGGISKNEDFSTLKYLIIKYVKMIVLIGKDARLIEEALSTSCSIIVHAKSMETAVTICYKNAVPGDIVLLSPACASFDMFKNFEHRGQIFINEVKNITK